MENKASKMRRTYTLRELLELDQSEEPNIQRNVMLTRSTSANPARGSSFSPPRNWGSKSRRRIHPITTAETLITSTMKEENQWKLKRSNSYYDFPLPPCYDRRPREFYAARQRYLRSYPLVFSRKEEDMAAEKKSSYDRHTKEYYASRQRFLYPLVFTREEEEDMTAGKKIKKLFKTNAKKAESKHLLVQLSM